MDRGTSHRLVGVLLVGAMLAGASVAEAANPQAAAASMDARVSRAGSYAWQPQRAPAGEVLVIISLPEQRAHIYRGGTRIGLSTVSTGSAGRETPTGQFRILQKKVTHRSNLYDDAPMPFMQRLTWDGIALHAGALPGYPASHGCIRLPRKLAEHLYGVTSLGTLVVVADESDYPEVVHPGETAPIDADSGAYIFPDAPPPPPPAEPPRQTVTVMGDGRVVVGDDTKPSTTELPSRPAQPPYRPFSGPVQDPAKRLPAQAERPADPR